MLKVKGNVLAWIKYVQRMSKGGYMVAGVCVINEEVCAISQRIGKEERTVGGLLRK